MLKDKNQSWKSFFIEIIVLISLVLFIRFYVFQFFRVSGPSMCPTLNFLNNECQHGKGEFIFVNEFLYKFMREPKFGEIVVFRPPEKDVYYIKRVLGVGGDIVEIRDGKVFLTNNEVKNQEIKEDYLSAKNKNLTSTTRERFVVPKGHFLLFGDNRAESLDSRSCFSNIGCDGNHTPFVAQKNIQGRAEFVIWPFWEARFLEE